MKYVIAVALSVASLLGNSAGCNNGQPATAANTASLDQGKNTSDVMKGNKMTIRIGSKVFRATFYDNATAAAFKAMLPLTLEMEELNGNEKKYDLSKTLPTNSSNPGTINNGDLMLWGSNTLVLFYKSFPTRYSYTRVGIIDDPAGLEAAVGPGNVTVSFELDQ